MKKATLFSLPFSQVCCPDGDPAGGDSHGKEQEAPPAQAMKKVNCSVGGGSSESQEGKKSKSKSVEKTNVDSVENYFRQIEQEAATFQGTPSI